MADTGSRLRGALLVSVVATLLIVPPLGRRVITTGDEARFALLARDMIERGSWFNAQVRGTLYRNKPPLYPWSIAGLSLLRGRVTEATAQAPVALAAIGAALFTFLLGDRLFNRRAGLWAALILATGYSFFGHSQMLLPDMIVVSTTCAAGYAFWRTAGAPTGRGKLIPFYAALALGIFAKGPVGLLPLLAGAVWLWTERGRRGLGRLWSPLGIGVFALVGSIWLVPFLARGTRSFATQVLWQDWLDQYLGVPVLRRFINLAIDGVMGFMPWTLVAPLALVCAFKTWRTPSVRFALLWFTVPLLAIMLSNNQRTRYLLPIYPGMALLVAWWAEAHGTARTTAARVIGWAALVAAGATVAAPFWFKLPPDYFAPEFSWAALPLVASAVFMGVVLFWGLRMGRPALLVNGVVGAMVVFLGYGIWLYNDWVNRTQDFRGLAASIERHAGTAEVGVFGGQFFSIDFYLGRQLVPIRTVEELTAFLARPDHPVVVVNGLTWERIQGQIPSDTRVLESMRVRGRSMLVVRTAHEGARPRASSFLDQALTERFKAASSWLAI